MGAPSVLVKLAHARPLGVAIVAEPVVRIEEVVMLLPVAAQVCSVERCNLNRNPTVRVLVAAYSGDSRAMPLPAYSAVLPQPRMADRLEAVAAALEDREELVVHHEEVAMHSVVLQR